MPRLPLLFAFVAALLLGAVLPASAQGILLPRPILPPGPRPPRPIPPAPWPQPLALKSQKVTMNLTDGALRVEVEQTFYNPNGVQMEGTYLFPLPTGATVSNFRMTVDKEPLEGKLLTVEEARRVYESYVRRNIDPAILEWVGRNAFQARVFPIPPNSEKKISLVYSQAAEFNGGVYHVVYPLSSERVTGSGAGDLALECNIRGSKALKTVYSPSHEIQVSRKGEQQARVSFEGKDAPADRDFQLYVSMSEKAFGLNALANRRPGEDGYAMLMLAPKREVAAADVQPKDVVFVFDTSGSMQGAKIEQARQALRTVLDALNPRDRFNILRFSSEVTNFRPSVVPATPENRAAARAFVEEFKAVGGTAIDDALQAAFASLSKPELVTRDQLVRDKYVLFMTDGLPTIGNTDIDQILKNSDKAAPAGIRLFTFGVGADVNTLLLDRLARDHRGDADYIAAGEDLETKIGSFYAKIAEPVLSDVQVSVSGAKFFDVYPNKVPDLFAGGQLLLLGRYQGEGKATVTLTGSLEGKPQRYTYDVSLPERELGQEFIPKLWANRKIGFLLEEIRLHGENPELKNEVIRLSKEYGIVTPYTSYLVEEPGFAAPPRDIRLFSTGGFGGGGVGGGLPGAQRGGAPLHRGAQGPTNSAAPVTTPTLRAKVARESYGFGRSTGAEAVDASKRVRALKDTAIAGSDVEVSRAIAGRTMRYQKGIWVDETVTEKMKRVAVKYGSEAYFQLVGADAEWARLLSAGRQVTLRTGKGTAVTVGETGKEKLTPAELTALRN